MSYEASLDTVSALRLLLNTIAAIMIDHVRTLNGISYDLDLGWYIDRGPGSIYAHMWEYIIAWYPLAFDSVSNIYGELEEGIGYDWDAWQEDHFITFGFYYDADVYDWDIWMSDIFAEETSWE